MLKLFRVMVRRDLLLAYRQKSEVLQTVFFFLVVITLVQLGVEIGRASCRERV